MAYIAKPNTNNKGSLWNTGIIVWFFCCYLVLGIILCNLLTTLIVEFHKVVKEENEPVHKEVIIHTPKGQIVTESARELSEGNASAGARLRSVFRFVHAMNKLGAVGMHAGDKIDTSYEMMVGKKRNWRYSRVLRACALCDSGAKRGAWQARCWNSAYIGRCAR